MLIKPATNKMAYAKIGIYGEAGSGKTLTACKIAIGLHKKIGSKKPIVAFDTEPGFSYVKPIFDKENIELLLCDETRALKDLMTFMNEAEKITDIVIIDSITHVWRDAQESFLKRTNDQRKSYGKKPILSLEFQHWRPIKNAWNIFTDRFLSSKMHVIVCGRAGSVYEYQENDSGKKELITNGTRMATEKNLGYEPSLLIEMISKREDGKTKKCAYVEKDRSDNIDGEIFEFPDFHHFEKHFNCLNLGGQHFDSMEKNDSTDLYTDYDQNGFDKEKQQRVIWSEKIEEHIKKLHPTRSNDDMQAKASMLEKYFNTRSWTEISETMHSSKLKECYNKMMSDYLEINKSEVNNETI